MNKEKMLHWINEEKKKIIAVGIVLLVFIVVAIGAKMTSKKADPLYGASENYTEATNNEGLNSLITSYYEYYCANNIEELEKIAYPISDMEKSYIGFMSGYTEKYEISEIFSKPGTKNGSYLISVNVNIKFKDVETVSPGLDFFYVVTDDNKNLYIDNRYCAFNQAYAEEETDPTIQALKEEFEKQEDVVALRLKINEDYKALVDSNEDFANFVNTTLHDGIVGWYSGYVSELAKAQSEEPQEGEEAPAEEEPAQEAPADEEAPAEEETPAEETPAEEEPAEEEPAEEQAAPTRGFKAGDTVTITEILNIREEADANSTKVGTALDGATLTILEDSQANGWTKIKLNSKEGYIRTDLLK